MKVLLFFLTMFIAATILRLILSVNLYSWEKDDNEIYQVAIGSQFVSFLGLIITTLILLIIEVIS